MTETTYFRRIECRYVREKTPEQYNKDIISPSNVFNILAGWRYSDQEHFFALHIHNGKIQCVDILSKGQGGECIIDVPALLRHALLSGAAGIILAHNHPGGNIIFSKEDIDVTTTVRLAGKVLGIDVLDHIVFSYDTYISMKEKGMI